MKLSAIAVVFSVAALGASVPAAAVVNTTFATYSATTGGANVRLTNAGTSALRTIDGTYRSVGTNVPGGIPYALVNFSFINTLLDASVNNVSARYTLDAVIAKNTPAVVVGTTIIQGGLNGSFSFVSTAPITIMGPGLITKTYAAGANLLSGTFTGGSIIAQRLGTSGSSFASGVIGTNITFTSDFLTFPAASSLGRSQSLTSITPGNLVGPNLALRTFNAVAGGSFSADPVVIPVDTSTIPEPATWMLLVSGFALVGVSYRRRSKAVAA